MDISNIIFAAITVVSLVGGVFISRNGSAADMVQAATGLLEPLQRRVLELEREVGDLKPLVPRVRALELWGAYLEQEVVRLGGVPIPFEDFLRRVVDGPHPLS
jgi:hypothetical protein